MEYTNDKFEENRNNMIDHFKEMSDTGRLYVVDLDKDYLWKLYLESFPNEIKGTYRTNAWHDCTVCRRFLQQYGGIVTIDADYNIITLFNYPTNDEYQDVMNKLDEYVKSLPILSPFYSSKQELGVYENFEDDDGTVQKHSHFYLEIPTYYVREGRKIDKFKSDDKASKDVLQGSLEKISLQSVDTVLELINENQLYRGIEWKNILISFRKILVLYNRLNDEREIDNFLWRTVIGGNVALNRIKNHSMGVLLKDLTKGKDVEYAVKKYESIVAPTNYKRPKPIFTQEMLDKAQEKITELGYLESLARRFARLSDISVNDIIYVNRDVKNELKDDLFKELSKDAVSKPKKFNNAKEILITDFTKDILPNATEVEFYFENKHCNNLVSIIAPVNEDAPSMFKWDNSFSWAYNHNLADSMKQRVKEMGGDVDVDLRFSIQWNDNPTYWNRNDLDAHCTTPNKEEIYYSHMKSRETGGWLDVDIIDPQEHKVAVENIRFKHRENMIDGDYLFRVHQFSYRRGDDGFKAEIEFDGEIYSFDYPHIIRQGDYVDVAKVTYKDGKFTIKQLLNAQYSNKKEWNITTNNWIPVNLICYSPNYWDEANATGNPHIFLMLKDCLNDTRPNAWYNEYLNNELTEHRKVMEALGSKAKVEDSEDQLSGVGFSLTKTDEFIAKVDGNIYKVQI